MPTIPQQGNMIMDWAKDQSVMDPLYETLLKKATQGVGDFMGAGDPASEVANLINPLAGPAAGLVTKIPFADMPARNFMLVEMLKKMKASPELIASVEQGIKTHPRVSAHLDAVLNRVPPSEANRALGVNTSMANAGTSIVGINEPLMNQLDDKAYQTAQTYGHELNHAAQRLFLGNDELMKRYNLGQTLAGPIFNPLETGSEKTGTKFANKMLGENRQRVVDPDWYQTMPEQRPQEPGPIDRFMKWLGY